MPRLERSIRSRRGQVPGGPSARPEPGSPQFRSTAELHNRLAEDPGRRGSLLAVACIGLVLLLVAAVVVTLWPAAA